MCGTCVQDRVKPEAVVCEADGAKVTYGVGAASCVRVLQCPPVTTFSLEPD